MKNKLKVSVFLIWMLMMHKAFASESVEILEAPNTAVIEKTLQLADADTLVIFDVDDVLIMPKDQILQSSHKSYLHKLDKLIDQKESKLLWSIIFDQRQSIPVDSKIKDIITDLQSRGVKVLALTHCLTGPLENIQSIENWRYHELFQHGYAFEKSWKELENKTFYALEKSDNRLSSEISSVPMFFKGIVLTEVDKGETLEAFLEYAQIKPTKIIFIDDKRKNLESVQKVALKQNIPFIGIKYTEASHIDTSSLNEKRADLQFDILKKEKKWISDREALCLLAGDSF